MATSAPFTRLRVGASQDDPLVLEIVLDRAQKYNVMDPVFFQEIGRAAQVLEEGNFRAAVLWAEGKLFTAGLDLKSAMGGVLGGGSGSESGSGSGGEAVEPTPYSERIQGAVGVYRTVNEWQSCFAALRNGSKPVICCVHSTCIGGGVDLSCFADVRLATADATFCIKETQIGIVADMGTLQRITKISNSGFARRYAFTGEEFDAETARQAGFVTEVFATKEDMLKAGRALASKIAQNSLLVVQGTKIAMNYSDEHNTEDSLKQVGLWNSAFLQSDDLHTAMMSFMTKTPAQFRNKL